MAGELLPDLIRTAFVALCCARFSAVVCFGSSRQQILAGGQ